MKLVFFYLIDIEHYIFRVAALRLIYICCVSETQMIIKH